jgi:hypothetical protein
MECSARSRRDRSWKWNTVGHARVEQEDLLATTSIAAFLRAGRVKELAGDLFLGSKDDTILRENTDDCASVGDGLHRVLN